MAPSKVSFSPSAKDRAAYGPTWREDMFKQYQMYVTQLDTLSTMREKTNEFFLTLQTALLGAVGFLLTNTPSAYHVLFLLLAAAVGMIESYFWHSILSSYRTLKDAKFKVLHEWEQDLPVPLFLHEMQVIRAQPGKYVPLTKKEFRIPLFFGILYLLMAFIGVYVWILYK